jgi:Flp pilus assembly protein TadD
MAEWHKVLQIEPDNLEAHCNLAWIQATFPDSSLRNGSEAVEHAERAVKLSDGKNARIWRLLAAAYAEVGRFPDAIRAAQNGMSLAEAESNPALVETLRKSIAAFEANLPLRDAGAGR